MITSKQLDVLRRYQAWRSGDDPRTMDEAGIVPTEISEAINAAIHSIEQQEAKVLDDTLRHDLMVWYDLLQESIDGKQYDYRVRAESAIRKMKSLAASPVAIECPGEVVNTNQIEQDDEDKPVDLVTAVMALAELDGSGVPMANRIVVNATISALNARRRSMAPAEEEDQTIYNAIADNFHRERSGRLSLAAVAYDAPILWSQVYCASCSIYGFGHEMSLSLADEVVRANGYEKASKEDVDRFIEQALEEFDASTKQVDGG